MMNLLPLYNFASARLPKILSLSLLPFVARSTVRSNFFGIVSPKVKQILWLRTIHASGNVRTFVLLLSHFLSKTRHLPFNWPYTPSAGRRERGRGNGNTSSVPIRDAGFAGGKTF
jgi:hypothetical protein